MELKRKHTYLACYSFSSMGDSQQTPYKLSTLCLLLESASLCTRVNITVHEGTVVTRDL